MEEKVMYVGLPNGAVDRRVKVTNGGFSNSYTEGKALPKPTALIGGTEVYQKEGTPYWFCRIKGGRDEFMNLYFGDLTKDDILYNEDGKKRIPFTEKQNYFMGAVSNAVENKPEEGFRWIPVYEPSMGGDGNLQYVAGKDILRNLVCYDWVEKFQNYSPENGSKMATKTTYFLLLLRLLKDGFATIEQLADDSKEIGHYCDSEDAKNECEKTGERQLGGLYGLAGNTYKIVWLPESSKNFFLLGGTCRDYGYARPLAHSIVVYYPNATGINGVGLLELTQ